MTKHFVVENVGEVWDRIPLAMMLLGVPMKTLIVIVVRIVATISHVIHHQGARKNDRR